LHYFGNLSVISPLSNALLLWTVPIIMQLSAIAIGVGMIWNGAGALASMLVWPWARLLIGVVNWVGSWSFVNFTVDKMSWAWVGGYYILLALVVWGRQKWQSLRNG
jgi:hypothetical protein